jgi:hypothetical protein
MMPTIDEFVRLFEDCPLADADSLTHRICDSPWATSEEREGAQRLVLRLEILKLQGESLRAGGGDYGDVASRSIPAEAR